MKKNWLAVGAVMGCLAGAAIGACGQAGTPAATGGGGSGGAGATVAVGTGVTGTGVTSGTMSTTSSTSTSATGTASTGSNTTSSTGSGATDGGICGKVGTLHPPADPSMPSLYCPFSGVDGGKSIDCDAKTQHCCEGSAAGDTSECLPTGTPCPLGMTSGKKATDWGCEDPVADCPAGQMCCGVGTFHMSPDPMCGNYASGFHSTHCAASCAAGTEIQMCTSDGECGGKKCTPFSTKGNQVGGCE